MARQFEHLGPADAAIATISASPRRIAAAGVAGLILVGWAALLAMAVAGGVVGGGFSSLGPGMGLFDRLAEWSGLERLVFPIAAASGLFALLAEVCAVDPAAWSLGQAGAHFAMWVAMALAMMLPSAAPLLRTYAEIADTAAGRGMAVVSPLVLAAGYLAVWVAFAVAATALHWLFGMLGLLTASAAPVATGVGATILALAGLYQFLPVKAACLVRCAKPFPYLFANWTERRAGVFRLGIHQGAFCLACCWAMMLVMFAVGVMNILWVAGLAAVMSVEKIVGRPWLSRLIGVTLLAWAAALAGLGATG